MKLTGSQMQKFLQKMQSDPKFSKTCKELVRTGNERKLVEYLRKKGFKPN